jgi:hypothetical protein
MGNSNSKVAPCPLDHLLRTKREKAKSIRYTKGKSSDFYFSCADGNVDEVLRVLTDKDSPSIDELNKLQPNGSTALHAATYYNHPEIVKLLLEHNCPRVTFNRFGFTAYEEAQTDEMKQLFIRPDSTHRFHETNTANTMSLYFPDANVEGVIASQTVDYVQVFQTKSEISEYSLNQQTTAMWLKFYNWFFHTFRTFTERDDLRIDAFDLHNHPDFQQFLKGTISDTNEYSNTMQSVDESRRRNSIEPLIALYTSEKAGFYRPFNKLLAQSTAHTQISTHLCDRFIIEFYIRRHELKQRAFTGISYRGATMSANDLIVYQHALASQPPGVLGLKAFTSTSRDPLVALNFSFRDPLNEGQNHVLFVFEITEISPTIFGIADISEYQHEDEVLILPGNLFIVTNIQELRNPPLTRVYLRHLNISISFWRKIKQTIRAGKKSACSDKI